MNRHSGGSPVVIGACLKCSPGFCVSLSGCRHAPVRVVSNIDIYGVTPIRSNYVRRGGRIIVRFWSPPAIVRSHMPLGIEPHPLKQQKKKLAFKNILRQPSK